MLSKKQQALNEFNRLWMRSSAKRVAGRAMMEARETVHLRPRVVGLINDDLGPPKPVIQRNRQSRQTEISAGARTVVTEVMSNPFQHQPPKAICRNLGSTKTRMIGA